jgi:hypothetical protein
VAYCLHICRPGGDADAEPIPIPLEEWRAVVAASEGVRLFAGKAHLTTNPMTGEVIKVSTNEGDAEVFFPCDGRWYPVFHWYEGSAAFNARLEPGDASQPAWAAAVSLAARGRRDPRR